MTGRITDIQRFSLNDGPGIRTTVFFKGCNIACKWCHNPETISGRNQLMFYEEKCIGCGKCVESCYAEALRFPGREVTVEEVGHEIMQDISVYRPK